MSGVVVDVWEVRQEDREFACLGKEKERGERMKEEKRWEGEELGKQCI